MRMSERKGEVPVLNIAAPNRCFLRYFQPFQKKKKKKTKKKTKQKRKKDRYVYKKEIHEIVKRWQ